MMSMGKPVKHRTDAKYNAFDNSSKDDCVFKSVSIATTNYVPPQKKLTFVLAITNYPMSRPRETECEVIIYLGTET